MRTALASLFTALSSKGTSHNSGFARILSWQLRDCGIEHDVLWTNQGGQDVSWDDYDEIYLYHGLDLNGKLALNLFGGQCKSNAVKLQKLAFYCGRIVPLHYAMPDYASLSQRDWGKLLPTDFWSKHMRARLRNIASPWRRVGSVNSAVGDSHVMSVWKPGNIDVRSGQTMHGFVEDFGDLSWTMGSKCVTLYFGNIDVRHHLCRQPDPELAARQLVSRYLNRVDFLKIRYGWNHVELVELSPIETEDREIPGSGCYKGEPFHGGWFERENLRQIINTELERGASTLRRKDSWSFYRHPSKWKLPNGEMDQIYMETPRSVHIAPQHYRSANILGF